MATWSYVEFIDFTALYLQQFPFFCVCMYRRNNSVVK